MGPGARRPPQHADPLGNNPGVVESCPGLARRCGWAGRRRGVDHPRDGGAVQPSVHRRSSRFRCLRCARGGCRTDRRDPAVAVATGRVALVDGADLPDVSPKHEGRTPTDEGGDRRAHAAGWRFRKCAGPVSQTRTLAPHPGGPTAHECPAGPQPRENGGGRGTTDLHLLEPLRLSNRPGRGQSHRAR